MTTHKFDIRVYYEDTDAGGIVYYANYLKFFERGRSEWLREMGIDQDKLLEQNIGFVVKRVEMNNDSPARFNQLLTVESQIVQVKRVSLRFEQTIINQDKQVLARAQTLVVCADLNKMKPVAIPAFILGEVSRVC